MASQFVWSLLSLFVTLLLQQRKSFALSLFYGLYLSFSSTSCEYLVLHVALYQFLETFMYLCPNGRLPLQVKCPLAQELHCYAINRKLTVTLLWIFFFFFTFKFLPLWESVTTLSQCLLFWLYPETILQYVDEILHVSELFKLFHLKITHEYTQTPCFRPLHRTLWIQINPSVPSHV